MSFTDHYELSERINTTEGRIATSGISALLRVPLDQHRIDASNGLRTAGLIAGYRGSPVGGVDQAYAADRDAFNAANIEFINGVNEELGATMVWGSQQTSLEKNPRFDGVMGMWYGKGPGIDRASDALRHANSSGVDPNGGVLAVVGDDPFCKSSSIASASEWVLADLAMPSLYPGSVQEVLDFGLYGYAMSRYTGAWVGFKIHSNVADAYATVDVGLNRMHTTRPELTVDGRPFRPLQTTTLIAPVSLTAEADMFGPRLQAAQAFMDANPLDRIIGATDSQARVGVVTSGPTYGELRDALRRLGFATDDDLAHAGIRLLKPAVIWPMHQASVAAFAEDLEEIFIIEEKRSFIETQIRDILYGSNNAPIVTGKRDDAGQPLLPPHGGLTSGDIYEPLRSRLGAYIDAERFARERERIPVSASAAAVPSRTAYFCSGCPHNRSTNVPEGSTAAAGIGCHGMALGMGRDNYGITHMGGEGAQWVGMERFVEDKHRFQNIGDGTFAHSGSLAVRQAISAGSTITYKILYNDTVAMTGGQTAAGQMDVPEMTRALEAEGVAKIVVLTNDLDKYDDDARFADNARVEPRDRLDDVQRELRETDGVTVLIYDQECAAELRRARKRKTIATPTKRIMIDTAICEGCGDCGEISNCASVHPIQTPFGRKTRIHQESCNYDYTCVEGNCPAFITVEVDPDYRPPKERVEIPAGEVPADPVLPDGASLVLVGIGGTGVVTVNQILSTAALLDGKATNGLDQTGMAQKGGPVVSNLRIAPENHSFSNDDPTLASARVGDGDADAFLVFDLLTAVSNLGRASADRTTAVVSTALIPTGAMVSGRGAEQFPELERFHSAIDAATKSDDNMWLDATGIARKVFASQPAANVLVVGVAYQKGLLPISAESIERAIELNGVAVETNLAAFRLGRRIVAEPRLLELLDESDTAGEPEAPEMSAIATRMVAAMAPGPQLQEVLAWRVDELIDYQDRDYAQTYVDEVTRVRRMEERIVGDRDELSQTVAAMLYKAMAYKDEYEVARLALKSSIVDDAKKRFGPDATISYMLKPPTMKAAGLDRKVAIPQAAGTRMFQGLLKTKRLRGTRLDPFGRTDERRTERKLIEEYRQLINDLLGGLRADNYDQAVTIAGLFDMVRGFDEIKLDNVARYRAVVAKQLDTYRS